MALPPLGLQCIVFGGKYSPEDPAVLDRIAALGYQGVECGAKDPAAFRKMLDERGLRYGGAHTSPPGLKDVRPIVKSLKTLGGRDICNSGLVVWDKRSLADYKEAIAILNQAGRQLRDEGISLHYHNHDFEFHKVDGDRTGMDILLDGLDPSAADLCVDVAWVMVGGQDPAKFLLKHKDIVGYLHFKDHDGTGWIELGGGRVKFAEVMKTLPELKKVSWVMIEQDSSKIDPLESIAVSRKYLKDAFGY